MKRFTIPIVVSTVLHGALLVSAVLVSLYWVWEEGPLNLGGGGGTGGLVAVELVDAGGAGGAGGPVTGSSHTMRRRGASDISSPRNGTARNVRSQSAPSHSTGAESSGTGIASAGSGGGSGGGHGGGIGSGIGPGRGRGNPVLIKIWRKINRSKYYPAHARKEGMEGAPKVRFAIGRGGEVTGVALASSCGIVELDQAALETVRRSAPLPYFPQPITLAIRYSMKN